MKSPLPRLGQRLEPSSQIGDLANDRLLSGRAGTDEVADNNNSGGDADAHLQGTAGGGRELRYRLDQRKSGLDGALGVMWAWG
jgi:hypothetical protein